MPDPVVEIINNVATVTVDEGDNAIVNIGLEPVAEVIEVGVVGSQGPQGPQGPQGVQGPPGPSTLAGLTDVDVSGKVEKSLLVFNQATNKFVANNVNTIITISDGGNF